MRHSWTLDLSYARSALDAWSRLFRARQRLRLYQKEHASGSLVRPSGNEPQTTLLVLVSRQDLLPLSV